MSEARALTNLIGNGVATLVVANWCKELDHAHLDQRLSRGSSMETDEAELGLGEKEVVTAIIAKAA